jgi:hypothetical protein
MFSPENAFVSVIARSSTPPVALFFRFAFNSGFTLLPALLHRARLPSGAAGYHDCCHAHQPFD